MTKSELIKIQNKSIEMQKKLFDRLENETTQESREWTAYQIAYQKSVYKAAMQAQGGGFVVDGIKPCSNEELRSYYNQLISE